MTSENEFLLLWYVLPGRVEPDWSAEEWAATLEEEAADKRCDPERAALLHEWAANVRVNAANPPPPIVTSPVSAVPAAITSFRF